MELAFICLIYLAGLVLLFLELFTPGAFLGFIGTSMLIAGIVLAFVYHPPVWGICFLAVAMVVVPTVMIWVLKQITLNSSQNLEDGFTSTDDKFDDLIGREGITVTPLRPSGIAAIGGRRIDVTAETVMLEMDTPIKIVKVEGSRIVVRATGPAQVKE